MSDRGNVSDRQSSSRTYLNMVLNVMNVALVNLESSDFFSLVMMNSLLCRMSAHTSTHVISWQIWAGKGSPKCSLTNHRL